MSAVLAPPFGILFNETRADDGPTDEDIDLSAIGFGGAGFGNAGGDILFRLRDGIERLLITDINNAAMGNIGQSALPIMWDKISTDPTGGVGYNHVPGGCNTLYLDGHVEFIRFPGKFPSTQGNAILNSLF